MALIKDHVIEEVNSENFCNEEHHLFKVSEMGPRK